MGSSAQYNCNWEEMGRGRHAVTSRLRGIKKISPCDGTEDSMLPLTRILDAIARKNALP